MLAWAEEQVIRHPYFTTTVWDPAKKEHVKEKHANTPARELAGILQAAANRNIEGYDSGDLREELSSLFWNGCKGYATEEALDEIMSELADPDNSSYEFGDLEDLLGCCRVEEFDFDDGDKDDDDEA